MKYAFKIGSKDFNVDVGEMIAGQVQVTVNGKPFQVSLDESASVAAQPKSQAATTGPARSQQPSVAPAMQPTACVESGAVVAPIPGLITEIRVKPGDKVTAGQCVATMEAMKMENQLAAHQDGVVHEIHVQKGTEVNTGQIIMQIG